MTDKEVRYSAAYVHQVLSQMAWEMLQHRPDMTAPLETKRLLTDHLRVMSRILANPELYFRFFLAEFNKITEQKKNQAAIVTDPHAGRCLPCLWPSAILAQRNRTLSLRPMRSAAEARPPECRTVVVRLRVRPMRRRNIAPTEPPPYTPKFQRGQRVRISDEGVQRGLATAGTMGTVEACGLVVQVLIDGADRALNYSPDLWEAPLLIK